MTVQGDGWAGAREGAGLPYFSGGAMAGYIIDIWKDDELVQSVTGKWIEDEARRLTLYYLGYYRGERAQLLRERSPDGRPAQDEVIAEVYAPQGAAVGVTTLW
jgi:hypothetical protein